MGLDRCKSLIIGGAPVRNELKYFYYGLALPLTDVYGLSEASGPVTLHLEHSILESCGKALEGIELKIFSPDSDGQGEVISLQIKIIIPFFNTSNIN